jgi:hypothetical protein
MPLNISKLFHQTSPLFMTFIYFYIIYLTSIIKGLLIIWIFYTIYDFLMLKFKKLERISTGDITFMWNTPEQTYNLFVGLSLDKLDKEAIKNLVIEKGIKKFRKLRSRLVNKYLEWWWEEVPLEECLKRVVFYDKSKMSTPIKTKEDLVAWAQTELKTKFDLENELPYKIIITSNEENAPEYRNLLIFKADHCMTDGISIMNLICGMADNYKPELFPGTMSKSFNLFYKILANILFPYYIVFISIRTAKLRPVQSIFKCSHPVSGLANNSLSKKYELAKYTKINKKLGMTFNDLMTSVISSASKKYMKDHLKEVPPHILVCFPINMKPLPKNLDEVNITNNSAGTGVTVKLIDDVITEGKIISKHLAETLRNVYFAQASKWVLDKMWNHMPFYLTRHIVLDVYKAFDITLSNVPGPKEQLVYGGSKVLDLIPLLTTGFVHVVLGVVSYSDTFKFILSYDTSLQQDPSIFIDYLDREMEILESKLN